MASVHVLTGRVKSVNTLAANGPPASDVAKSVADDELFKAFITFRPMAALLASAKLRRTGGPLSWFQVLATRDIAGSYGEIHGFFPMWCLRALNTWLRPPDTLNFICIYRFFRLDG